MGIFDVVGDVVDKVNPLESTAVTNLTGSAGKAVENVSEGVKGFADSVGGLLNSPMLLIIGGVVVVVLLKK